MHTSFPQKGNIFIPIKEYLLLIFTISSPWLFRPVELLAWLSLPEECIHCIHLSILLPRLRICSSAFFFAFFFKWEWSFCLAATGLMLPGWLVLLFFPYLSLLLIFCFLHRGLWYCPCYVAAEIFFISCSVTLLKNILPALHAVPTPASSTVH